MPGKAFLSRALIVVLFIHSYAAAGDGGAVRWFEKGRALAEAGKMEEAVSAFDLAIEKDPRRAAFYYNRGLAYESLEDHGKAVEDFSKALNINGAYGEAYFARGNSYFSKGSLWQAVRDYTRALELKPDFAAAYYTRGYAYILLKDRDDGLADIKKAAKMGHEPAKKFLKSNGIAEK